MALRVAYVGNFRPSFSTESHVAASLTEMGHEVVQLQEDEVPIPRIEAEANACDLLLYTRTWGMLGSDGVRNMPPASTEEGLAMLACLKVPSVSYHLDLYVGLARGSEADLRRDPFWRTKYVFTVDGDPRSEVFFHRLGIAHRWLRAGVYGSECYVARPEPRFRHDVVFVGSEEYHPEWPYRPRLVAWLRRTYGGRFAKYPNAHVPLVRGHDLNALYASAKVVVGDTLCLGFEHAGYWSDRVYETLGRGGFLVHPWIRGMEDEFRDGEHLAYYRYGDFDGLRATIDRWLADDAGRERVRLAGHAQIKARCTYVHRMTELLETVARYEPDVRRKLA